jgi:hypothetical protein
MGDVIRFSQAKKRLRGAREERKAAENRARFGRTKEQKAKDEAEAAKHRSALDQSKRDEPEPA